MSQELFVSLPDEDSYAQWKPTPAQRIQVEGLCDKLTDFYSSYYYWNIYGSYEGISYYFPAVPSKQVASKNAKAFIKIGQENFKNQNVVFIAHCSKEGNDDLMLYYRQNNNTIFLYDVDRKIVYNLNFSLEFLISNMEATI